jgi:hypothetical protein
VIVSVVPLYKNIEKTLIKLKKKTLIHDFAPAPELELPALIRHW